MLPQTNHTVLEAVSLAQLLASNDDIIGRIRECYGEKDNVFERDVMPLFARFSSLVHLLPATPDGHFARPGGMLRLGLEVAFFALQGCDGRIFASNKLMEQRRQLEPRWRLATLIAGLCCELQRVLSSLSVRDESNQVWPAYAMRLYDWLHLNRRYHYQLHWRVHQLALSPTGLLVLGHVVTPTLLANLSSGNEVIVPDLLCSVAGLGRRDNVMDDLVRRALAVVVDQDLMRQAGVDGLSRRGSHLTRFAVDAIRRLLTSHPLWRVNLHNGRVLWGSEGLFLIWPAAGDDIVEVLCADRFVGMPQSTAALLEHLEHIGLAKRPLPDCLWGAHMPGTRALPAIQILEPHWLVAPLRPKIEPLDVSMLTPDEDPQALVSSSPPVDPPAIASHPSEAPATPAPAAITPDSLRWGTPTSIQTFFQRLTQLRKLPDEGGLIRTEQGTFVSMGVLARINADFVTLNSELHKLGLLTNSDGMSPAIIEVDEQKHSGFMLRPNCI